MAEQIPYGVATSLINKIASIAFREIGRIYGVMEDLEKLKDTLENIKVVLSDAELRQGQDATVEHWIKRFKRVLHDADDLLDDVYIQDLRRKANGGTRKMSKVRSFLCFSDNPVVFRAKLARKIENIRKDFNAVADDMSKLNLNRSLVILKQDESSWRETSSFVLQSEIIGREDNKIDILNLLKQTHPNHEVSLVVVVGMGGLGKTALAQLLYSAAQEQNMFQKYMWVCVSEDFEVKTILKKILESLKKDAGGDSLEALQQKLREELNGQKYLLVLDDVWNENHLNWTKLRTHLMCGGHGSKILVTTRSKSVSETMGVNTPYDLNGLTNEQSWNLLKNVIFGEDSSKVSSKFQTIGEKIANKCEGVPLAIKTIGGLLRTRIEEADQWSSLLNGDVWRLCKEKHSIMPVLNLRQCFAYCCLYPKDSEIKKDELIQLWMAQGYLTSSIETQSLENVGNQYVKILLMGSFFQEASMNICGDIGSFKMHDLMHDLAMSVAGNDGYLHVEGKEIVGNPMHVAFETTISSMDMFDASKLRTIIYHYGAGTSMMNQTSIQNYFKYLRTLNLSWSSITQLPESIDKVKHLRYLNLSYCRHLRRLPKSVGNLVCLQTLKLRWCDNLVFPAKLITKLINLRCLDIEGCKTFENGMPAGLEKLTSLQYLSNFVVGDNKKGTSTSGKLNELKELNNIGGKLAISQLGLVEDVASESHEINLKSKKYIQGLSLYCGTPFDPHCEIKNSDSLMLLNNLCPHQNLKRLDVSGFPGVRFSDWLISLTNIVTISLFSAPNCQYLPHFERLPYLKELQIQFMDSLKWMHYYEDKGDVFFPSLEKLRINDCESMRGWERLKDDKKANDNENHVSLPSFPRLSSLVIDYCGNLTCMPAFPHLVEKLELRSCSMKPMLETLVEQESLSFCPLSALKHLVLWRVTDIEAMAEDWMKNLTSLQSLELWGSSIVEAVLRQLEHLPSQLQKLELSFDDEKVELWKDKDDDGLPRALSSLQTICFFGCENMKALPEQVGSLQSLRDIKIHNCPKVESLHEAERCLTNMHSLLISGCPVLQRRYSAESGEDWHKIAHIPNIGIY